MRIQLPDKNKYDAQHVLERISDEFIYQYYLGMDIKANCSYPCCFHKESTPSMFFKRMHNGSLIYKCFGCGATGNVFNFVKDLNNLSYYDAIKHVVDTFEGDKTGIIKQPPKNIIYTPEETKIITYFRGFSASDLQYWSEYSIKPKTLDYYRVNVCDRVYVFNGKTDIELKYSSSNPIFSYTFREGGYKIYRPLNLTKKGKFVGNVNSFDIQGITQLPSKGDTLYITSSLKDVMVLYECGFNAIAPQGEGIDIPDEIVDFLYSCFDNIIVLYDSDDAGYKYAKKLADKNNFDTIFIPEKYGVKDVSDFAKKYGLDNTKYLVNKLVNG